MTRTLLVPLFLAAAVSLRATIISQWTFETSQPASAGPFSPEVGSGSMTGVGLGTVTSPAGNGSAHSYNANGWSVGDYWQFQVSTTGFQSITVSFDQTGSSSGPGSFKLAYSTDGSSYTDFQNYSVLGNAWTTGSTVAASHYDFDLSAISAVDNAGAFYVRLIDTSLTAVGGGTVSASGTSRIDNFIVNGSAVTAPADVPDSLPISITAITLLGLHVLSRLHRRRSGESG